MRKLIRSLLVAVSGVVVATGVLAGCGGGKGPAPAAGNDAAYVSGLCASVLHMSTEAQKARPKDGATPEAIRKLSPLAARWADALGKLNPPADVRPYHEALVRAARASAAQLAAYQGHGDPFVPLERWHFAPQIGKRLQAVAAKDPDCAKADVHFDSPHPLGGGG